MQPTTGSALVTAALAPLIAWRVYVRLRRASGRQRLSRYRGPISLTIYSLLIAFVVLANRGHPMRLLGLAMALATGAGLAEYALHRTRFEPTRTGLYYTAHGAIGRWLAVLFAIRPVYRLAEVYALDTSQPRSAGEFAQSPLTLGVFGLMAGCYWWYMHGLVRWRHGVVRAKRAREARQTNARPRIRATSVAPTGRSM